MPDRMWTRDMVVRLPKQKHQGTLQHYRLTPFFWGRGIPAPLFFPAGHGILSSDNGIETANHLKEWDAKPST